VKDWDLDNDDELVDVTGTSISQRTSANPITIDEEEVEDDGKKQRTTGVAGPSRPP